MDDLQKKVIYFPTALHIFPSPGLGDAEGEDPVVAGRAISPIAVLCQDEPAD